MAFASNQQARELIFRSRQILVLTREHAGVDAVASALALGLILKKLNKPFDIVIPGFDATHLPPFLPSDLPIASRLGALRALHVKANVTRVPLGELLYNVKDGLLDITLIPREGSWTPQDITFHYSDDRYDLVIALGAADRTAFGALAQEQSDFLHRTTTINIDCQAQNEQWGQTNLVDVRAASLTELIFEWIQMLDPTLFDTTIATCLLAGIIAKTKSYRTTHVSPRTLTISSNLITLGAKRDEIVNGLWRTRGIDVLKLWGRALSRVNHHVPTGLVWTTLVEADFLESGAEPHAIDGVVEELISYTADARVIVLLVHQKNDVHVHVHANAPLSAAELTRPFNGSGTHERADFILPNIENLQASTKDVIERLQKALEVGR
jgi:nanoRNase/pAp phosphatase (c-di-AMP/oligoRNAs hydrolase)